MLRRAIAAVLVVTLAMLALPCGFAATPQHASHACCVPALTASPADCCNSAAPHPATALSADQTGQAYLAGARQTSQQFAEVPSTSLPILAQIQPAKRVPATILRT